MAGMGKPRAADQPSNGAKPHVSVRFSWKLKGEYAPLYVALDEGYFSKERLDVLLGEGAGSQAALASLMRGDDQAVWLPGIFALQAISKGMPLKLVALYNPAAPILIISWPEKPVRTPRIWKGDRSRPRSAKPAPPSCRCCARRTMSIATRSSWSAWKSSRACPHSLRTKSMRYRSIEPMTCRSSRPNLGTMLLYRWTKANGAAAYPAAR